MLDGFHDLDSFDNVPFFKQKIKYFLSGCQIFLDLVDIFVVIDESNSKHAWLILDFLFVDCRFDVWQTRIFHDFLFKNITYFQGFIPFGMILLQTIFNDFLYQIGNIFEKFLHSLVIIGVDLASTLVDSVFRIVIIIDPLSLEYIVKYHPHRIDVHTYVIVLLIRNPLVHVSNSADMALQRNLASFLVNCPSTAPKITNFSLIFAANQNIVRLQIPVDDELLMSICKSTGNIFAEHHFIILCDVLIFLKILGKRTSGTVLHHHVKVAIIDDVAIKEPNDVRVSEILHAIYFPHNLSKRLLGFLVEFFYGQFLSLAGLDFGDCTKRSLSQALSILKVVEIPELLAFYFGVALLVIFDLFFLPEHFTCYDKRVIIIFRNKSVTISGDYQSFQQLQTLNSPHYSIAIRIQLLSWEQKI